MGKDAELTAYLLRYLLDSKYFKSMEEIANTFDISKRQVQRLVNETDSLKGGSIVLSKILQYFGYRKIPFDPVLIDFIGNHARNTEEAFAQQGKSYLRFYIPMPEGLPVEKKAAFAYYTEFVGLISSYVCPECNTWCDPWDGSSKLDNRQCFITQLAKELLLTVDSTNFKKE